MVVSDPPYCIHCNEALSSYTVQLVEHCRTCVHMSRPDPFRHKFVCYRCSYFTYNIGNIKTHINTHIGEKPFSCKLCDYRAVRKYSLQVHIKQHHNHAWSICWTLNPVLFQ